MSEESATRSLPARRRSRPPRRRRHEVLETAARVFHEKGYESTSIQDIADAVGILKGSLYYYITSKEDLLFEILQGVHQEAMKNIDIAKSTPGDALQKIRAFVTLHVTHNAKNLIKMAIFFHDFRSLGEERRKVIVQERDLYDRALRDLIAAGQREGIVCPDLDPKLTAIEILGMMNWIYHWYKQGGPLSPSQVANAMADFVVAGIHCDRKTHVPGHRRRLAPLTHKLPPTSDGTAG